GNSVSCWCRSRNRVSRTGVPKQSLGTRCERGANHCRRLNGRWDLMIHIRLMTQTDLPLGMRLKTANGWNQTEADWRRYLDLQPDGCFVAMLDGTPVGTLTSCIF